LSRAARGSGLSVMVSGGERIVRALRAESSNRRAAQFRSWDRLGSKGAGPKMPAQHGGLSKAKAIGGIYRAIGAPAFAQSDCDRLPLRNSPTVMVRM